MIPEKLQRLIAQAQLDARMDTAHDGASHQKRDLIEWVPTGGSADADILPELDALLSRSRDLERNNGYAHGIPQTFVDNVIGPQLKLSATPDWRTLGRSKEWAMEWSNTVEARWKSYARSLFFDKEQQVTFTGMAGMVLRGHQLNGGHVVLPMWLPNRPGAVHGTCFQSVEIDRLCNPDGRPDSKTLRGGIEYDTHGAPRAYWIRNDHPGDEYMLTTAHNTWTRVPARMPWGRPRALHCFIKTRGGQSRGVPAFTSILREFKSLSRYRTAELAAAVANAQITFFIETQMGIDGIVDLIGDQSKYVSDRKEYLDAAKRNIRQATMEENTAVPLYPGDRVTSPQQNRPNSEFAPFNEAILRHIAAGLNISYETLARDFSQTNYSSARAALQLDWKTFIGLREWLITAYAQPVYSIWLEEQVNKGDGLDAPDFYANRDAYCSAKFTGAGRGQIDPVKETRAATERLRLGLSTLEDEAAEQGKDYQEIMNQRAREIAEALTQAREHKLPEWVAWSMAGVQPPNSVPLDALPPDDVEPPARSRAA